jgi:hypothetical protein
MNYYLKVKAIVDDDDDDDLFSLVLSIKHSEKIKNKKSVDKRAKARHKAGKTPMFGYILAVML